MDGAPRGSPIPRHRRAASIDRLREEGSFRKAPGLPVMRPATSGATGDLFTWVRFTGRQAARSTSGWGMNSPATVMMSRCDEGRSSERTWIASDNGRVLTILSITQGQAASAAALAALGISAEE